MDDTDHDPHDIIPDGFCEAYGEETIPAAIEAAERAPSTTDIETRKRCPVCFTTRLRPKPNGYTDSPNKIEAKYKCNNAHHFDDPWPPAAEIDFEWLDTDELDERSRFEWADTDEHTPERGSERYRTTIRRAIELSKPWSETEGRSLRETAAYIPFSRAWVNSRRQEWRDGQHRDLVSAPRATPTATADTGALATDGGTT